MRTDRKKGAGIRNESFDLARPYPQCSSDGLNIHTDKFGARFGSQGGKAEFHQVCVESCSQTDRYDGQG